MNDSIRVSAKTVDDAITEALIRLGVTSDRLEYEVIEKGSAGFLGIGMKQAVIEARRKPEEAKETFKLSEETNPVVKKEEKKAEKREFKKADKEKKEAKKAFEKEEAAVFDVQKEAPDKEEEAKKELKPVLPETIQAVETFLKETLAAMHLEVKISSMIDEEGVLCVNIDGDHMGVLIGKRGQTLDSLQYLANRVANKHQDDYVRVKIDTENYRQRREETLRHLAKNIAHKVKRTRRSVVLEPMNPYERRIIHFALQNDPYVTTHSEGEEPYRKIIVTLKK